MQKLKVSIHTIYTLSKYFVFILFHSLFIECLDNFLSCNFAKSYFHYDIINSTDILFRFAKNALKDLKCTCLLKIKQNILNLIFNGFTSSTTISFLYERLLLFLKYYSDIACHWVSYFHWYRFDIKYKSIIAYILNVRIIVDGIFIFTS